ncbi:MULTISPECIES: hypothetical protein [Nitrosomonas]|uniref:Uncharacterized protein n=1 Tax=Nitrosomonas communis TaxID=44574 RepID=A0A1H2S490_9PROT|nr:MULTISPECIES: hypothetical protein [Nitrosomonas]TYP90985.1 hypothetical protein BCL69_10129 [Nitrosomonas communis]UVS61675.1 hypothetical protein NX761_00540 [Nitrosomonas sp. PLL12]SDW26433.1 hypothetical protein SAMN05421882_100629 [Nitrosomonas communis]
MDWEQLLSTERLGRGQEQKTDARSEYQRDYDVLFSPVLFGVFKIRRKSSRWLRAITSGLG